VSSCATCWTASLHRRPKLPGSELGT